MTLGNASAARHPRRPTRPAQSRENINSTRTCSSDGRLVGDGWQLRTIRTRSETSMPTVEGASMLFGNWNVPRETTPEQLEPPLFQAVCACSRNHHVGDPSTR